jgi:hypothetical protein
MPFQSFLQVTALSDGGADSWATIASLIQTAKLNTSSGAALNPTIAAIWSQAA